MDPKAGDRYQHPLTRSWRRLILLGLMYLLIGLAAAVLMSEPTPLAWLASLFGAGIFALGLYQRRLVAAVPRNNAAFDLIARGRFEEAEALLDSVPESQRRGAVGVAILSQRMYLALLRGDFREAVRRADEALIASSSLSSAQIEGFTPSVRSYRALALAACGRGVEAVAEAARAEALTSLGPQHRGVATLARAVAALRADDRAALAEALSRLQSTVGALNAREAMLARTLQRYAASPSRAAYRSTATGQGEASPARDWIAAVAPAAADFAPRASAGVSEGSPGTLPASSEAARAKITAELLRAKESAKKGRWWPAFIAGVVTAGTLAADIMLRGAHFAPGALLLLAFAWIAYLRHQNRRGAREIREALARHTEQPALAEATLKSASRVRLPLVSATALFHLAEHAERRNDLDAALASIDLAYGRIAQTEGLKAVASDILMPSVLFLRARLLAALGRADEALAMTELAERDHPTFPFAASASLCVRVVAALSLRERPLARSLARGRPTNVPIPPHVALLCDLLAAEDGYFEADGEPERIATTLDAYPGDRAWIERVAPEITAAVTQPSGVRVATQDDDPREMDAAQEALEGVTAAARRAT